MSEISRIRKRRERRVLRVKRAIKAPVDSQKIRISVFRSLRYFYAQAIDDTLRVTVASVSSREIKSTGGMSKVDSAYRMGEQFAALLLEKKKISNSFVFDRGRFLYHGRVKSFVEGLRAGGVQI